MPGQFFKDFVHDGSAIRIEAFHQGIPLFHASPEDHPITADAKSVIIPQLPLEGADVAKVFGESFDSKPKCPPGFGG
jgi:hypothetical protein